nr:MAG TPA: hypothetical protein [Caudoviricetes sp.]
MPYKNSLQYHGTDQPPPLLPGSPAPASAVPLSELPVHRSSFHTSKNKKAKKPPLCNGFPASKHGISGTFWQNLSCLILRKSYVYVWKCSGVSIPPADLCENSRLRGRRYPGDRVPEIQTAPPLGVFPRIQP